MATIFNSVAEAVVMPALHEGGAKGMQGAIYRLLVNGGLSISLAGSLVLMFVLWLVVDADIRLVAMLAGIPVAAALSSISIGLLNATDRFHLAVLGPMLGTLPAILIVLILPVDMISLAAALLAFEVTRWIAVRTAAGLSGVIETTQRFQREARALAVTLVHRTGWQLIGAMLISVNPLIDIFWASTLPEGSVSLVEYAAKLWNAVPLLFTGLLVLKYSRWSRDVAANRFMMREATDLAGKILLVLLLATPAIAFVAAELIPILFGFGNMETQSSKKLGWLVAAYLLGAAPMVSAMFLVRAISARGRLNLLALGAAVGLASNALADWVAIAYLGVLGIGLATSFSYWLVFLTLRIAVARSE